MKKECIRLKGMDFITVNLIVLNMDAGHSFETIKKYALKDISNRSQKSQLSKKLDSWYNEFIEKTTLDIQTKKLDEFYNFIGWK